nr:unnamed protein product [Digitaria exilis]
MSGGADELQASRLQRRMGGDGDKLHREIWCGGRQQRPLRRQLPLSAVAPGRELAKKTTETTPSARDRFVRSIFRDESVPNLARIFSILGCSHPCLLEPKNDKTRMK